MPGPHTCTKPTKRMQSYKLPARRGRSCKGGNSSVILMRPASKELMPSAKRHSQPQRCLRPSVVPLSAGGLSLLLPPGPSPHLCSCEQ